MPWGWSVPSVSHFWGRLHMVSPSPGHLSIPPTVRSGQSLDLLSVNPGKEARWLLPPTQSAPGLPGMGQKG